jgi:hypothetical protein
MVMLLKYGAYISTGFDKVMNFVIFFAMAPNECHNPWNHKDNSIWDKEKWMLPIYMFQW